MPEYEADVLIDIVNMEVKEKSSNEAIISFVIHNPNGDSIDSISISDLHTNIVSQVYMDGKSYVELKVEDPEIYVSKYAINRIDAKSYSGIRYSKRYGAGEKYLYIDFYREIRNVEDWISINSKLKIFKYESKLQLDTI